MSRTVYVNGDYLPEEDAKISVFDRGFLLRTAFMKSRPCWMASWWIFPAMKNALPGPCLNWAWGIRLRGMSC